MLRAALLAGLERGLNAVLRLDPTALARLEPLAGRLIEVDCQTPAWRLFILPDGEGLRLAGHWEGAADVTLRAPAAQLLRLAVSRDKTAILHEPGVTMEGDSQLLLSLSAVLDDLQLDWEHELSRWLGPVAAGVFGSALRSQAHWIRSSAASLQLNLADYLGEEARSLVGNAEAQARFSELDALGLNLDRLEARVARLAQPRKATPEK